MIKNQIELKILEEEEITLRNMENDNTILSVFVNSL